MTKALATKIASGSITPHLQSLSLLKGERSRTAPLQRFLRMTADVRLASFAPVKRVRLLNLTITTTLLAVATISASGCFWHKKSETEKAPSAFTVRPAGDTNVVMTPATSPVGRIASVNAQAKFAVISFPIGQLPANETKLSIFRAGAKVGEIRITGPAQENFTVGDIMTGAAQEGDEVRGE